MTGSGKGETGGAARAAGPPKELDPAREVEVKDHSHDANADPRTWLRPAFAWRDSIRSRPSARRIYKIAIGAIGGSIMVLGLILVPLPGPGWLIVFLGLAILASEFVWADRLEKYARRQVMAWTHWLGQQHLAVRALAGLLTFALLCALVYGVIVLLGVPPWVPPEWVPDLPGL